MTQYDVATQRKGQGPHSISLTLSRPLAGNQVLIIANEGGSLIPIQDRDNEGALKDHNNPNKDYELLASVFLDYKKNELYIKHSFRLDSPAMAV